MYEIRIKRDPPDRAFTRAAFAIAKNALDGSGKQKSADHVAARMWPHDQQAIALTRAATSLASTTSSGWAGVLAPAVAGDFLPRLASQSAAAKLIAAGVHIDLTGLYSVSFPHRTTNLPAIATQWVAENGAFPVKQFSLSASVIGPMCKLATSVVASRAAARMRKW
jgi:hypothetical protein